MEAITTSLKLGWCGLSCIRSSSYLQLLGTSALLVTSSNKDATRNKKLLGARASLLGAPGIATRSILTTSFY